MSMKTMKFVFAFVLLAVLPSVCRADTALPEGYVKLTSVRPAFVLGQYVDTGYTPAATDRLEMDVTFENADRGGACLRCFW